MNTLDHSFIAPALFAQLNSWPARPADFGFEAYLAGQTGLKLHMLPEAEIYRAYTDGGRIVCAPFQVKCRIRCADSAASLSALRCLTSLAVWLRDNAVTGLPEGCSPLGIGLAAVPAFVGAYDDGHEEYGAEFRLLYGVNG